MAKSRFEYVKGFENHPILLPNTYIAVRIDGRGFHQFSKEHNFTKPNDVRALDLMNRCAKAVMEEYTDIVIAYGESDEFSFVISKKSQLYKRRESKIVSCIVSKFSSSYVFYWKDFMGDVPLKFPPTFDARAVCYPSLENIRDYLSWRQADTHINNLYNTCFWLMVQDPSHKYKSEKEVENILKDTNSSQKNELLFSQYNVNYAKLPEQFRKGSVLYSDKRNVTEIGKNGKEVVRSRRVIVVDHCDIIGEEFWKNHPHILQ